MSPAASRPSIWSHRIGTIQHRWVVGGWGHLWQLGISTPWFGLGIVAHPWGVRLMLGTVHVCIHLQDLPR